MHYNTIFLAIFTLFAAGTLPIPASARPGTACVDSGQSCILGFDCCSGIVYLCQCFCGIHSYVALTLPGVCNVSSGNSAIHLTCQ